MNYLREIFIPGFFYSVEGLRPSLWFFVMQNKVLAGRDQEWADAMGRPLSVVYFEKDEGEADAPIARRCDGGGASLEPTAATLAEQSGRSHPPLPLSAALRSTASRASSWVFALQYVGVTMVVNLSRFFLPMMVKEVVPTFEPWQASRTRLPSPWPDGARRAC